VRVLAVAFLLGCGAPAQPTTPTPSPPPTTEVAEANVALHWTGEWTSLAENVKFAFDIRLTANGKLLDGRILWTLMSVPPGHFLADRVNDTGTEIVRGTWDPKSRTLHLKGVSVDDREFLVTDEYKLVVATDGQSFDGRTRGSKGDWMNEIHGTRADP
jgi:hypothetical protein